MHSRIFGIVEKNFYDENIDNYNWNLDIFEEETPSFADYCSTNTDIDKDFMWLIEFFVNDIKGFYDFPRKIPDTTNLYNIYKNCSVIYE